MASPVEAGPALETKTVADITLPTPPGELEIAQSPTLLRWQEATEAMRDRWLAEGLLGYACLSAARRIESYATGDIEEHDLPVSASLGMLDEDGLPIVLGTAVARDKELDSLSGHAEPQLTDLIPELGVNPEKLTLAVGIEPCLTCLPRADESGLGRMIYGATRLQIELMNLIKHHDLKAPEFVELGRQDGHFQDFDLLQFNDPAVADTFADLFLPFQRDRQSEETGLADPHHREVRRFRAFTRDVDADLASAASDTAPKYQGTEFDIVLANFRRLTGSYRG